MNAPLANHYDPLRAARLCQASARAYAPFRRWNERVIESRATDTVVLLIDDGAELIAAFRGTQDLRNWLTDLDCRFVPASLGRVHAGFTAALNSVYAPLAETLFDAHCAGKTIWLTGHSLGGALALLAARQLIKPFAGCYTFGQPRVGDAAYCASHDVLLKDRCFRVVHDADVVPRVPWLLGGYRHAGHEIYYADSLRAGAAQPMIDPSLLRKLPWDVIGMARELGQGRLALLADHHVNTYLNLFKTPVETCSRLFPGVLPAFAP